MKYILKSMITIQSSGHTIGMNVLVYEVHNGLTSQLVCIPLVWTTSCTKYIPIYSMFVTPLASTGYLAMKKSNPAYTPPPPTIKQHTPHLTI